MLRLNVKKKTQPFPFLLKAMSQGNEKLLIEFWIATFDSFNAIANRSLIKPVSQLPVQGLEISMWNKTGKKK